MSLKITTLLCLALTLGASAQTTPPAADAKVPAVGALLFLRTAVDSSGTKPGKVIKADLQQAVTLPGGVVLPKGTSFTGTVLEVSKHSKEKPNGTLLLEFTRAFPKGKDPVEVMVRIQKLAPSAATSTTLPNANGGMVTMAATSGGGGNSVKGPGGGLVGPDKSDTGQLGTEMNDRSDLKTKYEDSSTIDGVYVTAGKSGSGLIFSYHEDCYLDSDIHMIVLIAPASPAN